LGNSAWAQAGQANTLMKTAMSMRMTDFLGGTI
jgi:hypothetical protein